MMNILESVIIISVAVVLVVFAMGSIVLIVPLDIDAVSAIIDDIKDKIEEHHKK